MDGRLWSSDGSRDVGQKPVLDPRLRALFCHLLFAILAFRSPILPAHCPLPTAHCPLLTFSSHHGPVGAARAGQTGMSVPPQDRAEAKMRNCHPPREYEGEQILLSVLTLIPHLFLASRTKWGSSGRMIFVIASSTAAFEPGMTRTTSSPIRPPRARLKMAAGPISW